MTGTSEFDLRNKELQEKLHDIQNRLEITSKEFLEASERFTILWFRERVRETILSYPGRTKTMGANGLGNLKFDLSDLIAKVPTLVDKYVNCDKFWIHRTQGRYYMSRIHDRLDGAIRELLGYVGSILQKYGFINKHRDREWGVRQGTNQLIYKGEYDWSKKMNQALDRYIILYEKKIKIYDELEAIRKQEAINGAKELWAKARIKK